MDALIAQIALQIEYWVRKRLGTSSSQRLAAGKAFRLQVSIKNRIVAMIAPYLWNCFWLVVPVLLLNVLLMRKLPGIYQPAVFGHEIPIWISVGENVSRGVVFVLPIIMPLAILRFEQRVGLLIYLIGFVLYSLSWTMQIVSPKSSWSQSRLGFMAPGYTPAFWLLGIAFIGDPLYFSIPYSRWIYIGFSGVFLMFHNLHCWIVYTRARRAESPRELATR